MKLYYLLRLITLLLLYQYILTDSSNCSYKLAAFNLSLPTRQTLHIQTVNNEICFLKSDTCCFVNSNIINDRQSNLDNITSFPFKSFDYWLSYEAQNIQNYYMMILNASKKDLHEWMQASFDHLYLQNSHILLTLWTDIEQLLINNKFDLFNSFQLFFTRLAEKFFFMMQPDADVDNISNEQFFECLSNIFLRWPPFGPVPRQLSQRVKASLLAANLLISSIARLQAINSQLAHTSLLEGCQVNESLLCSVCEREVVQRHMCTGACQNYIASCHRDIEHEWKLFIDQLIVLLNLADGPFNLDQIDSNINHFISKALHYFKNNNKFFLNKVNRFCTSAGNIRNPRHSPTSETKIDFYFKSSNQSYPHSDANTNNSSIPPFPSFPDPPSTSEPSVKTPNLIGTSEMSPTSKVSRKAASNSSIRAPLGKIEGNVTGEKSESSVGVELDLLGSYKKKLKIVRDVWAGIRMHACAVDGSNVGADNTCWNSSHWVNSSSKENTWFSRKFALRTTPKESILLHLKAENAKLRNFISSTRISDNEFSDDEDTRSGSGSGDLLFPEEDLHESPDHLSPFNEDEEVEEEEDPLLHSYDDLPGHGNQPTTVVNGNRLNASSASNLVVGYALFCELWFVLLGIY